MMRITHGAECVSCLGPFRPPTGPARGWLVDGGGSTGRDASDRCVDGDRAGGVRCDPPELEADVSIQRFTMETRLPVGADEAFAWHARPGAFERLLPPWQRVEVVERTGGIRDGDRVTLRVRAGPLPVRWILEHRDYVEGRQFRDVQVSGPFRRWEHTHEFIPVSSGECVLRDQIECELPFGAVGRFLGRHLGRDLARLFTYRHRTTHDDLQLHATYRDHRRLVVAVSGASGLIGRALCALLTTGGHRVVRLVRRRPAAPDEARWDPVAGVVAADRLDGIDAVVHLAGENIAAGRWTPRRREALRRSRVEATRALVRSLAALSRPPRAFLCASAVGIYGDRGDEVLDEDNVLWNARGFLPAVCRAWETQAAAAGRMGMRWVGLRFGVVLSPAGGMLARLLPVFKMGLGGPVGSGRQYVSWISIDDVIGAIYHALVDKHLTGPVNVVAPHAVTNAELTAGLARVLRRPAVLRVPGWAAKLAFGQMADEAILCSARAVPAVLTRTGYRFRHAELEDALRHLLGAATE